LPDTYKIKMSKTKKGIVIASLAISTLLFSGCGSKPPVYKVTLDVWGLFDNRDAYEEIFANYAKLNPNVQINYRKLTSDTYREDIIEALASGQGPDIFLINNTWLPSFGDKLAGAPPEIFGEQKFRGNFPDVVIADFLNEGKVFAVPLTVDSLNLFYNKNLFNEAGITSPPEDWNKFVDYSRRMTKIDNMGQIIQAGAALGTAYNINRSTDVLSVLMLQNGTNMTDSSRTSVSFDKIANTEQGNSFPGENALTFYTQFAKASAPSYSWNKNLHYSIDAFAEGKLGMMLNYSWQRDAILNKSPKLNFDVAPLPQISGSQPVSYANYWGYAVSKNKSTAASGSAAQKNPQQVPVPNEIRIQEAWKLLSYLTAKPEATGANIAAAQSKKVDPNFDSAKAYLVKTGKPAARRDLIELQKSDSRIGVFAKENLIAKNWYQIDPAAEESIFAEMIDQVNRGQFEPAEALKSAAAKINQMMMSRR